MKGIVWIASYPKSGNTWFRAFLTNLKAGLSQPADINHLVATNFADRTLFDTALGWESSDLGEDLVARVRLSVQETLAHEDEVVLKTHEAFTHPVTKEPLFSANATRAALYIVRNPLDVVVSYAHHLSIDIDSTIGRLDRRDQQLAIPGGRLHSQLPQVLGDWSWHVTSWTEAPGLRLLVLRYEDMLKRPIECFTKACNFLGLPCEAEVIELAVKNSSFAVLQAQESARGFGETPHGVSAFFRRGRSGSWREVLTASQISAVLNRHRNVMLKFGYAMPDGSPFAE